MTVTLNGQSSSHVQVKTSCMNDTERRKDTVREKKQWTQLTEDKMNADKHCGRTANLTGTTWLRGGGAGARNDIPTLETEGFHPAQQRTNTETVHTGQHNVKYTPASVWWSETVSSLHHNMILANGPVLMKVWNQQVVSDMFVWMKHPPMWFTVKISALSIWRRASFCFIAKSDKP